MLGSQVVILITIAVYLIAMVLIGVYFGKKGSGNSSDDFYLGGRKQSQRPASPPGTRRW